MLAACPRSNLFDYTPQRSSPLSMRDADGYPQSLPFTKSKSTSLTVKTNTPLPRRSVRSNSAVAQEKERNDRGTRQRDLFLKKVRRDGEERKWQSRSEELLRLDFVSMEKRWRADLARTAPEFTDEPDEEAKDSLASSESEHRDDYMVEHALQHEQQELDELLSIMETPGPREDVAPSICHPDHEDDTDLTVYGGDDDDYDSLFKDVIQQGLDEVPHLQDPSREEHRLEDDMDMSGG